MTPQDFIARWDGADGSERANFQLFFNDLCDLLEVEYPQPALADDWHNAYVNERYIDAQDGESAGTARYIDTYHRGRFICEAKSFVLGKQAETADRKLFKAKSQAESYARNLPESEPRPPILMVVNVGRFIALYAQFKDNDRAYEMYPDRASYKIAIADLARDDIRERLRRSGSIPTRSIPNSSPPASPAPSPRISVGWRASWKKPATIRTTSPGFSPAACSPCLPKTWRCCPPAHLPGC